jgi:hypothetical protein
VVGRGKEVLYIPVRGRADVRYWAERLYTYDGVPDLTVNFGLCNPATVCWRKFISF